MKKLKSLGASTCVPMNQNWKELFGLFEHGKFARALPLELKQYTQEYARENAYEVLARLFPKMKEIAEQVETGKQMVLYMSTIDGEGFEWSCLLCVLSVRSKNVILWTLDCTCSEEKMPKKHKKSYMHSERSVVSTLKNLFTSIHTIQLFDVLTKEDQTVDLGISKIAFFQSNKNDEYFNAFDVGHYATFASDGETILFEPGVTIE